MYKWLIAGAGLFGIVCGMCGCSRVMDVIQNSEAEQGAVSESELAQVLPLMVIEEKSFRRDYMKMCSHTRECTAPLICADGKCDVPPSILGRAKDNTPKLTYSTESGEHSVFVEIVDDEYTMARGLMMRRTCHEDWGMLFVYQDEGKRAFWMSNTYIPLDMVFIRANGTVSNVALNAVPLNEGPRYLSTDRVRYVLELPAGTAEKYGIQSGSKFDVGSIR